MAVKLKVLFFDVETAPLLSLHWRTFKENISPGQIVNHSFMLTWSAKWRGEKEVLSARLTADEAKAQDDTRIVVELADLIRSADIIVAHNIDKFDLPVVNSRLLILQAEPLDVPKTIDTLKLSRASLRMSTNNLDNLAQQLGLGRKIKTDFELWRRCYLGEVAALKEMETYNKQDVILLEQVFEKMLPYVKGVPRLVDGSDAREDACPYCGSTKIWGRGWHRSPVNTYQKFQCQEPDCRKYFRHYSARASKRLMYNTL